MQDTTLEVFGVGAGGALTSLLAISNLIQAIDIPLPAGTSCKLAVSSAEADATRFTVYLGLAPANDHFRNAEVLLVPATGGSVTLTNANVFATVEPEEAGQPQLGYFQRHGNLWWKFTAPEMGGAEFHLLGSPVPGIAAVYTGNSLTNLQLLVGPEVANGNPVAWVPFSVQSGVTYWIAAGGNPGHDDTLGPVGGTFNFVAAPQLVNDAFEDRVRLQGARVDFTDTVALASTELAEPAGQFTTLWWEWEAPGAGAVQIQASGVPPNAAIKAFIFTGDSLP